MRALRVPGLSSSRRRDDRVGLPSHFLICAFSVSSTTRSNDDPFGAVSSRASATYLSRLATRAASFSFKALRCFICLLSSSMRCSGFSARRFSGLVVLDRGKLLPARRDVADQVAFAGDRFRRRLGALVEVARHFAGL